jgi:diacylglycerol kinase (ATP)
VEAGTDAGVDVIVNRVAGRLGERSAVRRAILAAAGSHRARIHETRDLAALERVAREIASRGTDAVVLAGGDGSAMRGVSALARAFEAKPLPPIALAPGGTMCTIARNHGMRGTASSWAERVVHEACARDPRVVGRPTLRVLDDREGPGSGPRIGSVFGAGLVGRFFELYDASPHPGALTAAALAARVFAGSLVGAAFARRILEPTPCRLEVDGVTQKTGAWSFVLASVVRDVGLHFLVPYRAGESLDRFHTVASGLPPQALGRQLPRVLLGRPLVGDPRVDTLARSLRLSFEGPDGAYILDGDLLRARSVSLEPGPVISWISP